MAKALFLGLPLHGHTNPTLPLVRELVGRGEEVTYFSSAAFEEKIRRAGARFRPYRNAFLENPSELSERMDRIPWLLMRTTGEVLARELDAFREERPDYVISDSVAPWGQWVAQVLGVPVVTSVTTFAINRHVVAFAASQGNRPRSARLALSKLRHVARAAWLGRRLRREHGVRGTGIPALMFGSSDLNVVYTSREFQPRADTFDERFLFVGPSIDARVEPGGFPWSEVGDGPLVYVSMGTLFNTDPAFYRRCFEAFGGENVQVVMSIGDTVPAASLGSPPANVVVKPWVPQLEVLRRASVFVSHGGMNSVGESLSLGVPLVVVPRMGEQEIVARQVERLGAGVRIAPAGATADRLRQAVRDVLGDGGSRARAAALGESLRAAGGAARAADAILAFTRSRTA
jgi:MGT family glycosyltransferase